MRTTALASMAVLVALALVSPAASSAQTPPPRTVCNGTLSGVIQGDIIVPRLGSCVLDRAIVTGQVTTAINSRSLNVNRTVVVGALECGQCRRLDVTRSWVGGTFGVREASDGARICGNALVGEATFFGVGTALLVGSTASDCAGNVFGGPVTMRLTLNSVTAERNLIGDDFFVNESRESVTLNRNLIDGTLSCENNALPPTGSGNVARSKTGQCAGL
jgi:hypothetical protein